MKTFVSLLHEEEGNNISFDLKEPQEDFREIIRNYNRKLLVIINVNYS